MSTPTPPENTKDVSERHRFDVDALRQWMDAHVAPTKGELRVRQFRGGQSNPTFWVADDERSHVLRKKPPGELLPSAHQVEREHRVLAALADTDVPVAEVRALCEDDAVIGTPFYVMEHVVGRIFWNVQLPDLSPDERSAVYEELVRVLAAIHSVDVEAVGLSDYGKPAGYVRRQVERWSEQYRKSETQTVPAMDALIEWLPENLPAHDETTLVHGDYRLDNLIFHPTEPRCLAVIDWELSTLGHPFADLAYTCMLYDIAMPGVGGLLGVDFEATGIPSEPQFVARYRELTGRAEIERWPTFKAFSLFRLAAIAQGVYQRSLQGNASSDDAAMYGAAVGHLATIACNLVGISV
ncbi:MAG TPA: phosphotransferase family protein [Sandaracinaceae bacterium LLY-WYZ-13_1]|nr:phosphotransferase family protein [Sandaracinaceae bacterium LLY-WYZ-13_1]